MIRKFTQHLSNGVSLYMTKWFMAVALPFLVSQAAQAQLNYVPTACNDPYVQDREHRYEWFCRVFTGHQPRLG